MLPYDIKEINPSLIEITSSKCPLGSLGRRCCELIIHKISRNRCPYFVGISEGVGLTCDYPNSVGFICEKEEL